MVEASFIIQFCNSLWYSHFLYFFRCHSGLNSNRAVRCLHWAAWMKGYWLMQPLCGTSIGSSQDCLEKRERCFLYSPSIPQRTAPSLIQQAPSWGGWVALSYNCSEQQVVWDCRSEVWKTQAGISRRFRYLAPVNFDRRWRENTCYLGRRAA